MAWTIRYQVWGRCSRPMTHSLDWCSHLGWIEGTPICYHVVQGGFGGLEGRW